MLDTKRIFRRRESDKDWETDLTKEVLRMIAKSSFKQSNKTIKLAIDYFQIQVSVIYKQGYWNQLVVYTPEATSWLSRIPKQEAKREWSLDNYKRPITIKYEITKLIIHLN